LSSGEKQAFGREGGGNSQSDERSKGKNSLQKNTQQQKRRALAKPQTKAGRTSQREQLE
jgi:hypothetical protein